MKIVHNTTLNMKIYLLSVLLLTENSNYWEGPNNDESYGCFVRVRAWKMSSMPVPDFHLERIEIHAFCEKGKVLFERYQCE